MQNNEHLTINSNYYLQLSGKHMQHVHKTYYAIKNEIKLQNNLAYRDIATKFLLLISNKGMLTKGNIMDNNQTACLAANMFMYPCNVIVSTF